VNRILAVLEDSDQTPIAGLAFTGMRAGELQRLQPDDLELDVSSIHFRSRQGRETKTRLSRKVSIHAQLRPLLGALPKDGRR
jgi:integrase